MTALPKKLFAAWFEEQNITQPVAEAWGVGMVFLPQDADKISELKQYVEHIENNNARIKEIKEEIKDVLACADNLGLDPKIIKKIVSLRQKDRNQLEEEDFLVDLYINALDT